MNPSTAQAEVLLDELVRNDVRHAVLAPGSRNAPLALALHAAATAGRISLHVRIDERSAGFLALGLAARLGEPVAVVCTSGTAAVNLHPAVREARHAGVPMLVLTADRPVELRAAGANQTTDQHGLYGGAAAFFDELGVAENRPGLNAYWRSQVCRASRAARGDGRWGAPAHLDVPFREPLVPDGEPGGWCESLDGRAGGGPWTRFAARESAAPLGGVRSGRGLVLVADDGAAACAPGQAERAGWPVLAETGGVGPGGPNVIAAGMWLLGLPGFLDGHRPEQVVCLGRPTVFRQVQRLLADAGSEVLLVGGDPVNWPAPAHDVAEVAGRFEPPRGGSDPDWLAAWQEAGHKASAAVHAALDVERWPSGPAVAGDVVDALPSGSLLVVGASNPARDVALAARARSDVTVHRNRGVAGIDGFVSTALGAAVGHGGPSYALLGDLSFLHDANGLLLGPHEQRPDLTIVVVNDDGGGIFSLLEQGGPEHADSFERVFGTPHGTDLATLCSAHGVPHVRVRERSEFAEALRFRPGLRVVEVPADRERLRGLHERLRAAVTSAVLG